MSTSSAPQTSSLSPAAFELIRWQQHGVEQAARWRSERGAPVPKHIVLADDTTTADVAYRSACAGTALLWCGDFQNARQLLSAMARRCDTTPVRKRRKSAQSGGNANSNAPGVAAFHQHRLAQSQRARILGMLLVPIEADYALQLRRAPDVRQACTNAWGIPPDAQVTDPTVSQPAPEERCVTSLRELMGLTSAQEWRRVGVEVPALGAAPNNRIHPHYGVFSPARGEYIDLVSRAPWPANAPIAEAMTAFDVGTGTGVLAAVLVRRGVGSVVATDLDPRALACAAQNLSQLGVAERVTLQQANLFPEGQAHVVVCNPPWVPARPSAPIERAVYDENSAMLRGYLTGLSAHLLPGGEGWLILSDLAEHLGLRTRAELLDWISGAGLCVLGRMDARPQHPKAAQATDLLAVARRAEVTSLWRLGAVPPQR